MLISANHMVWAQLTWIQSEQNFQNLITDSGLQLTPFVSHYIYGTDNQSIQNTETHNQLIKAMKLKSIKYNPQTNLINSKQIKGL